MKLYNTLTRTKEEFIPQDPKRVKMYSCGPTVYNYFHVGNARPFIIFDVLRRYLEYRGYKVDFVQNFTDIDDKVIKKANEEGTTYDKIADRYIKEYFVDAKGLGIKEATVHPKATDAIPEIIEFVQRIIDKGYAYEVDGDVYFSTQKFKGYGKLSRQPVENLMSGARIDINDKKKHPLDFVIWKAAKEGEPSWSCPWGKGRPGWHIECSVMINKYLGNTIDIHSGGQDLVFPHHENEIAQSEAANGCEFSKYWLHNGFLTIDNQKMSKSLNNFFMVRDAAKVYGYDTIRMFMLSAHYRNPLNYSEESLKQSKTSLERLCTTDERLRFLLDRGEDRDMSEEEQQQIQKYLGYKQKFIDAMDDDLNTADALSCVFELVRAVNTFVKDNTPSVVYSQKAIDILKQLCMLLGFNIGNPVKEIDFDIDAMIELRQQAKSNKDFAKADEIRDELLAKGIVLKDTRQGVQWSYS